jgi:hypothetical protein
MTQQRIHDIIMCLVLKRDIHETDMPIPHKEISKLATLMLQKCIACRFYKRCVVWEGPRQAQHGNLHTVWSVLNKRVKNETSAEKRRNFVETMFSWLYVL